MPKTVAGAALQLGIVLAIVVLCWICRKTCCRGSKNPTTTTATISTRASGVHELDSVRVIPVDAPPPNVPPPARTAPPAYIPPPMPTPAVSGSPSSSTTPSIPPKPEQSKNRYSYVVEPPKPTFKPSIAPGPWQVPPTPATPVTTVNEPSVNRETDSEQGTKAYTHIL